MNFNSLYLIITILLAPKLLLAQEWINYSYKELIPGWDEDSWMGYELYIDSNDHLWITSTEGLIRFDGESWTAVDSWSQGFVITSDKNNNIWISDNPFSRFGSPLIVGLAKFDGQHITKYTTANTGFQSGYQIWDMLFDHNNVGWFVGDRGALVKYDGKTWKNLIFEGQTFDGSAAQSLTVDRKGNVWICAYSHGVFKYHETNGWEHFTTTDGLASNHVRDVEIDRKGNVWFATGSGLTKYDGSTWMTYNTEHGLESNYIPSIKIDTKGHVWFVNFISNTLPSQKKLYKFDGEHFIHYPVSGLDVDDTRLSGLSIDSQDNIWVRTSETISMLKAESPPIPLPTDIATTTQRPVSLYPNPATESVTINCADLRLVEIYTLLGQRVLVSTSQSVDVSGFSVGSYVVRVHYGDEFHISKLLVE